LASRTLIRSNEWNVEGLFLTLQRWSAKASHAPNRHDGAAQKHIRQELPE